MTGSDVRRGGSPSPARGARRSLRLSTVLLALGALTWTTSGSLHAQLPNRADGSGSGWIGISFATSTRGAGSAASRPVRVLSVSEGSPAQEAGLRPGDRIVRIDEERATPTLLRTRAAHLRPGDRLRLIVERAGEEVEAEVVAARRPASPPVPMIPPEVSRALDSLRADLFRRIDSLRERRQAVRSGRIEVGDRIRGFVIRPDERPPRALLPYLFGRDHVAGARLTPLNPGLARYFSTETGVLVTSVVDGTPAAEAGLRPGDILLVVSGRRVESLEDVRAALTTAPSGGVLRVLRHGKTLELTLAGPGPD